MRQFLYLHFFLLLLRYPCTALPQDPSGYGGSPSMIPPSSSSTPFTSFGGEERQSFEERAAAWRHYQQEKQQHQTAAEAASPTDEQGRMKLLASVSSFSITLFFFLLMWRAVHHYEMADITFGRNKLTRILFVVPTVLLFLADMAGCVASFSSSSGPKKKKRLKAILNANKLMELTLFCYNVSRLILVPSKYVPREIYVGRILSNFVFLVQCQLFTKVAWNVARQMPSIVEDTESVFYPTEGSVAEETESLFYPTEGATEGGGGEEGGQYQYEHQQQQPSSAYGQYSYDDSRNQYYGSRQVGEEEEEDEEKEW